MEALFVDRGVSYPHNIKQWAAVALETILALHIG